MKRDEAKKIYDCLFNKEDKAEAFDKLAELYYYSNFGSTGKTQIDILMFSLYFDQILKKDKNNWNAYSDYTLSKQLGITQTKVSNLKVKKELLYPFEDYDWKAQFVEICKNAVFEENKIKLYIPNKIVFLEIKNIIETNGGFVELQFTGNLLQVRLSYFLDLLVAISDDKEKTIIKKNIADIVKNNDKDICFSNEKTFGKNLYNISRNTFIEILKNCMPAGTVMATIAEGILKAFEDFIDKE